MNATPRRADASNTGVVSAAGNGLAIVVFVSLGLQAVLRLGALDVIRAAALFALVMTLAVRYLRAHHPFPHFGPANQITTLRAALVSLMAGFIGAPSTALLASTAAGLGVLVTLLDGVDGWFARKTRMSSTFGARFDMEVDALLILLLSLLAWRHDKAPAWVVLSGAIRYAFVVAGWLVRRLQQPLPASRRRQTVCVVQIVCLIAIMLPPVLPPMSTRIAALALLVLVSSFAVDTWWLWRQPRLARVPAHS